MARKNVVIEEENNKQLNFLLNADRKVIIIIFLFYLFFIYMAIPPLLYSKRELGISLVLLATVVTVYLWPGSNLKLNTKQTSVPCDGKSILPIKVQFINAFGKSRKQKKDRKVEMETTSGSIQNDVIIPAGKDFTEAILTSSNKCGPVTVTAKSGKQRAIVKLNFIPPAPNPAMKHCHNCGFEVGIGTRKCPNCRKNPYFSDVDTKQCSNCKEDVPLSAKFCHKCGEQLPS